MRSNQRWRPGTKNPFTLYRQLGPEPDRRPWPDGDEPLGFLAHEHDVDLAVRAVNSWCTGGSVGEFTVPYATWTRIPGTGWEIYQGVGDVHVVGDRPLAVMILRAQS